MDHHLVLSIFHVAIVAPFFIYVGIQRASSPEWLFRLIFAIGVVVILFHSFRAYGKWRAGSSSLWVNIIHVVYVGPLMLWIGSQQKETPRAAFEMLLLLAFATGGYHLYNIVLQANTVTGGKHDD